VSNVFFVIDTVASTRIFLNEMNSGPLDMSARPGQGPKGSWLVRSWYTSPHCRVLGARAAARLSERVNSACELKSGANSHLREEAAVSARLHLLVRI
jgi:hypothetical protein